MLKILHADDHALFRDGMRYLLTQLDEDLILLTSDNLTNAVSLCESHRDFDLILLDLNMPGMDGMRGLQTLWRSCPTTPVVVLSGSASPFDVEAALDHGAAGYVPKSAPTRTLLDALKLVLDGGIYAPRASRQCRSDRELTALTARQFDVLRLLAEGRPNKLIARQLFITEATVKGHVSAILGALAADNRTQAVQKAQQIGLLRSA